MSHTDKTRFTREPFDLEQLAKEQFERGWDPDVDPRYQHAHRVWGFDQDEFSMDRACDQIMNRIAKSYVQRSVEIKACELAAGKAVDDARRLKEDCNRKYGGPSVQAAEQLEAEHETAADEYQDPALDNKAFDELPKIAQVFLLKHYASALEMLAALPDEMTVGDARMHLHNVVDRSYRCNLEAGIAPETPTHEPDAHELELRRAAQRELLGAIHQLRQNWDWHPCLVGHDLSDDTAASQGPFEDHDLDR